MIVHIYNILFVVQITLVGKITSTHEAPTHLSFTIDDGTGKIELSYWTSSDDDQDQVWSIRHLVLLNLVYMQPHRLHILGCKNKPAVWFDRSG